MSKRFAEPPGDAWTELGRDEYDSYWATFNARIGFRAGVSPDAWPAIREESEGHRRRPLMPLMERARADMRTLIGGAAWIGTPYGGVMFGRKSSTPPEDPAVAPVEAIFNRAAIYREVMYPLQGGEPFATTQALWICACVTMDDAPIWLIYEDGDHEMVWSRVPNNVQVSDVITADLVAGGHADPGEVLAWLEGEAPDPWAGGGDGNSGQVLDRFSRMLRRP